MYKDAPASETDSSQEPRAGGFLSANTKRDVVILDAPAREAPPKDDRPAEPAEKTEDRAKPAKPGEPPAAQDEKAGQGLRKGFLRRHPVLAPASFAAISGTVSTNTLDSGCNTPRYSAKARRMTSSSASASLGAASRMRIASGIAGQ